MKKFFLIPTLIFLIFLAYGEGEPETTSLSMQYEALQAELQAEYITIKTQEEYNTFMEKYKRELGLLIKDISAAKLNEEDYLLFLGLIIGLEEYDGIEDTIVHGIKAFPEKKHDIELFQALYYANIGEYDKSVELIKRIKEENIEYIKTGGSNIFKILQILVSNEQYNTANDIKDLFLTAKLDDNSAFYLSGTLNSIFLALNNIQEGVLFLNKLKDLYDNDKVIANIENDRKLLSIIGKEPSPISSSVSINGETELEKYRGKVILLDFWAPWCGPCRQVIPNLVEIYDEYKDKDLVIIGITQLYGSYTDGKVQKRDISPEEEVELVKGFIRENGILYPNGIVSARNDIDKYFVAGIPHLVFIDKEFTVRYYKVGYAEKDAIIKILKKYL